MKKRKERGEKRKVTEEVSLDVTDGKAESRIYSPSPACMCTVIFAMNRAY